jgi:predicted helicase
LIEFRSKGEVVALNEPKREKCGAPDYVVSRKRDRLTIGWVEAKDFGLRLMLDEVEKSAQLKRYFEHLPNLLVTDYLEFRWYVRGERGIVRRGEGHLGRFAGSQISSTADDQQKALQAIDGFLRQKPARLTSARDLAIRLADFTQMIRGIIVTAFAEDEATESLRDWRTAFVHTLLPELAVHPDVEKERAAVAEFADMFAQTLTYGLFSARAASPAGAFNRENARKLVPRTNPFLRNFFEQITGAKLDDEPFAGFVEDIIQTLGYANIDAVLADFGTRNRRSDPVVHFYETFLQAYDPKLRELRGVYYTPEPVVNYIVESLDKLLKEKFGIKEGLADRSKITVTRTEGEKTVREESHRVLILDPATGTFLYRVLDFIRQQFDKKNRAGAWGDYVHEHLLPRLFGFELLMAPYAVAHFKLGLALAAHDEPELWRQRWSYEPRKDERINIFLTNTLEDLDKEITPLIGPARALSSEADAAKEVKENKPVLVILGNPPYSGHSANKGKWINSLIRDYFLCDGKPLGERNPKWLNDDYVKFIRWAQWRIEQTGSGILGFITNHGYLDNPTFRGMRQNLMQTFDEIYLLDLHGNSKKKEIDPATGAQDKNVFDIQQGVAIGIFVKLPPGKRGKKKSCVVQHAHLYSGQRKAKYEWLDRHDCANTTWTRLKPESPNYFFFPRNLSLANEYERGWRVPDMMPFTQIGPNSYRDAFAIAFTEEDARKRRRDLADENLRPEKLIERYALADSTDWVVKARAESVREIPIIHCLYRPFDERVMIWGRSTFDRPREDLNHHLGFENAGLLSTRQTTELFSVFSTIRPVGQHKLATPYDGSYVSPLYLYPNGKLPDDDLFVREEAEEEKRRPNFSADFIKDICARLKVKFVSDGLGKPSKREAGPELIFNYAYAVFHSPSYRERYADFLRTDFPRLPLTSDYELFRKLAGFGGELVDLHARNQGDGSEIAFPMKGGNVIEEVRYQPPQTTGKEKHAGRVWINDQQYFEGIPESIWRFPIGGYFPAERWLKDRKGRTLFYEDKEAYTRIVAALGETARLMKEIDGTIVRHGGWPNAFDQ